MYRARLALLACSSLVFVVLLHLAADAQEAATRLGVRDSPHESKRPRDPKLSAGTIKTQIRQLQEERVAALKEANEIVINQYRTGSADYKTVFVTQHALMDAMLDLADTREDRIRALESLLKNAKLSLELSKRMVDAGVASKLDLLQAKSAKISIEIKLLRLVGTDQAK